MQVQKDLQRKTSHLYLSLFDSARFSTRCAREPRVSDKEFFLSAKAERVEVARTPEGLALVTFASQAKGQPPREWFFRREGDAWKLAEGLVVGRCSCGM